MIPFCARTSCRLLGSKLYTVLWSTIIFASLAAVSFGEDKSGKDKLLPRKNSADQATTTKDWQPLFNGHNFDGWYTFLQKHGKNSDPDHIISIENETIHLYRDAPDKSLVVMGYIATEKEYENYHLRLQYRWGKKKFRPLLEQELDAGLYYHITGPDAIWPCSLQFQIQKRDVGNLLALNGVCVDTWSDPAAKKDRWGQFLDPNEGGIPITIGGNPKDVDHHRKRGFYEIDGWNTVEIVVRGDASTHWLNGHVVNRCESIRQADIKDPSRMEKLSQGRIAIEVEAGEIFYRQIEVRSLSESGE